VADENNTEVVGQEAIEQQTQEPQFSDVEKRAMEQGWVPEDQWEGQGKWRPADEFLDRGELFGKIDEQRRAIKSLESTQTALKQHLELVRKNEYARALSELKAERKEALADGDADAVVTAEDKIERLRVQAAQEAAVAAQNAQTAQSDQANNPLLTQFMARNPWYGNDKVMKIFADEQGHKLAMSGLTDHRELLLEIERRVKREFPDKFTNPNRSKASAVDGGGIRSSGKKDSFELTDVETQMMKRLVRAIPGFTEAQYIADIKAAREQGK
jgi:hypothetical protein